MISRSFDIKEFIAEVKGHSYLEIIRLADAEATAAERRIYKAHLPQDRKQLKNYATVIKDVILYMRHGVLTRATRELDLEELNDTHQH
jgi:hypothetical protein